MTLASREKRLKPVSTKCRLQTAANLSGGSRPSDKRGRGRSSRSLDKGGGWSPKKLFSVLRASVCCKNKGVGAGPAQTPPLDPPLDRYFHHANENETRIVPLFSNPENNGLCPSAVCILYFPD